MERLADAITESGLDIRWSAEIRLEKVFHPDRCKKIAESGCICLSFGMESGNQRILDLIDKGTKVAYMGQTMKNFAAAGVAVQLMAFSGFPTETTDEANETREFVREHADYWSAGGVGQFLLTGTSIIARNPEQFRHYHHRDQGRRHRACDHVCGRAGRRPEGQPDRGSRRLLRRFGFGVSFGSRAALGRRHGHAAFDDLLRDLRPQLFQAVYGR